MTGFDLVRRTAGRKRMRIGGRLEREGDNRELTLDEKTLGLTHAN
jgi:hypothetical protein